MNPIAKAALMASIPIILGLAGNFVKNKFDVFSDDLNAQKAKAEQIMQLTADLRLSQDEMKKYVDLNLKLTNDKIKLQKKYLEDIERINNEKFDKITLFSSPGRSVIIHSGMLDTYQGDVPTTNK